jgi:hypothetical protein
MCVRSCCRCWLCYNMTGASSDSPSSNGDDDDEKYVAPYSSYLFRSCKSWLLHSIIKLLAFLTGRLPLPLSLTHRHIHTQTEGYIDYIHAKIHLPACIWSCAPLIVCLYLKWDSTTYCNSSWWSSCCWIQRIQYRIFNLLPPPLCNWKKRLLFPQTKIGKHAVADQLMIRMQITSVVFLWHPPVEKCCFLPFFENQNSLRARSSEMVMVCTAAAARRCLGRWTEAKLGEWCAKY